ncbi:hypothetical protein CEUSTIGMA_g4847.t1 [Chlamydomonas eustigma]|uniref:BRO1 domain-containing protein n=1 Tax=Chlamydomonas eustigma TaxID=1157962 RepID=A0A250X2W2_9CHLO|nr:hypothetical protein CEUSTIGMA_g4847.t1 [Chlamydomonas eustigma]|eukprot:GAX77401.1 hypothetical protein CEUSTIGMA_g4847.t1 [Chlamydomonas eustigma]
MKTAKSVMLALQCKHTEVVDVKGPLLSYIRATYSDKEADDAAEDLTMIQQLRSEATSIVTGGTPGLKEAQAKYLRCLAAIETRFPISKDKGQAQVNFTWCDAFQPKKKATQANIHFEKAALMFNLGAVMSQIAIACDRSTGDGLKQACQLFQEGSGIYSLIRENECIKLDNPKPMDLTVEVITLLEKLMLTQAQECFYHKAVVDKKSASVVARLARQLAVMYSEVERLFTAPALQQHLDKSWLAHAQMKASIYDVETLIQVAKTYQGEEKINYEISVLQEAFKRVQATKKICKGISNQMYESVSKVQDSIQSSLTKAEKDNSSVYLQRVPPFMDLPSTAGALLVKLAIPSCLEPVVSEVLFASLIPDSSAKALSKYTEMVDSKSRSLMDKLATATDNARLKLKEVDLPDMLEALDNKTPLSLPEALRRELEEIESIGGLNHLKGILTEVGQLRESLERDMQQCSQELDNDAQQDAEARAKYGEAWRTPAAATMAKPYWDKVATFRSTLQRAGDSDQSVISRLKGQEEAFASLTISNALNKMPRLEAPMVNMGPEDPVVLVANLRRNLKTLETLAAERAGIEEAIKEMKQKDNVLPKLMATVPQSHEALFASEMKKYDGLEEDVNRNLEFQGKVLTEVEANAMAFQNIFDVNGWRKSCEGAAAGMRESSKTFRELLDHLSEGLRFYLGTSEVVRRCLQECQDFVFTRGVQRDEVKQDLERQKQQMESDQLARQLSTASLHPGAGVPAAYPPPPGLPPPLAPAAAPAYAQPSYPPPHNMTASSTHPSAQQYTSAPAAAPNQSSPTYSPPAQYQQQQHNQYAPQQQQYQGYAPPQLHSSGQSQPSPPYQQYAPPPPPQQLYGAPPPAPAQHQQYVPPPQQYQHPGAPTAPQYSAPPVAPQNQGYQPQQYPPQQPPPQNYGQYYGQQNGYGQPY